MKQYIIHDIESIRIRTLHPDLNAIRPRCMPSAVCPGVLPYNERLTTIMAHMDTAYVSSCPLSFALHPCSVPIMNLLEKIENHTNRLTSKDRVLADHLVQHYPQGLLESATQIANKLNISASTVVRFFAKLGYASFNDVQREARMDIASKLASPSQRAHLAASMGGSSDSALDQAIAWDKQNIDTMRAQMDDAAFNQIVDLITRPTRGTIYIIAAKNSQAVALYLSTHLNMCAPDIRLLDTSDATLADNLLWATSNDILLAFSIRRYSKMVLRAVQHFHGIGATVVGFTDSPTSPVQEYVDHPITIFTRSDSPFDSYTSVFCLCNALISAVASKHRKETETILRQAEDIWRHFDVFVKKNGNQEGPDQA
ncbi:MAG TPA: MurR/RpiR family transcriptional regulator [Burkholderiaceae bacterium]|nr:MurR/RpiR family transcriptional regulator [Burkholderiaceae bacterium]